METNYNFRLPGWLIPILGVLLIAFVGLAAVQKGYEVSKNFKPSKPDNTISISAEGKVTATPDVASVNLGVFSQATSASTVQDSNSSKINQVIAFVKQQGIPNEDIVTSQVSIYPQYDYSGGSNRITGYQANQTVTVKVRGTADLGERVGRILDGATDNGANEVQGVYLSIDDPDELRQEARKKAIAKAKEKAAELAAEAGLTLGKVVSISESGGGYPIPLYYGKDAVTEGRGGAAPSVAPDIQTGSQEITENVTMVFEIK